MKKRVFRSLCVYMLLFALVVTSSGLSNVASAASKKASKALKLSAKTVTVTAGKSKKVTVKNKPKKAKVQWSSKNKKIAKVKNGKITGVKAGKTKVICKVTYKKKGKKVTKKFTVKVTVKKKATTKATKKPTTKATTKPAVTPAPTPYNKEADMKRSNVTKEHKSKNGIDTTDNGMMRKNISNLELMQLMGYGWNLGNQMEQSNYSGAMTSVEQCETSAGNAEATQKTFDGLKSYGVNTVRIPVAWSNFISDDGKYTINEELFDRVETIVNYALNDEMYVIINIHWDGGWWGMFGAEEYDAKETPIRDEAWKKYISIWTQISERFKEYSDHLIFEGANEELSGRLNDNYKDPNTAQQNQTGKLGKKDPKTGKIDATEIYEMANAINQKFVDIVRASGGNNAYRHLLIPGSGNESCVIEGNESEDYVQNGTLDERWKLPNDPAEKATGVKKMSVSVHYYDPVDYGLSATSTAPYGYRDKWGVDYTDANGKVYKGQDDYDYMDNMLGKLKKFTDQGYGIILGECGVVKGYKDNVTDFMEYLFTQSKKLGMTPVWWDEGHYYNRGEGYFAYDDVGQVYAKLTGSTPKIPANAELVYTGIKTVPAEKNEDPKVVATWEGEFLRHTNGDTAEILKETRKDDFDTTQNGIGKTTSLTDALGNVTTAADAKTNYSNIFGKWWEANEFWKPGDNVSFGWTNSTTGANGEAPDALIAEIDRQYWNIHMQYDWSKLEKPCIRVYPADDEISQSLDLQIGYLPSWTEDDLDVTVQGKKKLEEYIAKQTEKDPNFTMTDAEKEEKIKTDGEKQVKKNKKNGAILGKCTGEIRFDVDYDQGVGLFWKDKSITIDKSKLTGGYPWLWVTTNTYTGASIVKIEICDAAYNADGTKYVEPAENTAEN
ncbi:MAG: cellulase family glycosylhydrolase [Lachnospiraceae bacterium]|nr:cellulase family glycosylhydrolase [Lachnospiraceae bacterium]